jgi:hypothetical protein
VKIEREARRADTTNKHRTVSIASNTCAIASDVGDTAGCSAAPPLARAGVAGASFNLPTPSAFSAPLNADGCLLGDFLGDAFHPIDPPPGAAKKMDGRKLANGKGKEREEEKR